MSNYSEVNNENIGSCLTSKHAVVFPEVTGITDSFEYVKAIGAIVGVNQIHSVICMNGIVKVYLKEIKFVQVVANSGFRIGGQCTPVELADESATKVTLCNVDSVIPDYLLEYILRPYGDLISKVVGVKFNNDVYSSHVEFGEKQVYMNLYPGVCIPNTLDVVHENKRFKILTRVKNSVTSPFQRKPQLSVPAITSLAQPDINNVTYHRIHSSDTEEINLNVESELNANPSYTEEIQVDSLSNEVDISLQNVNKVEVPRGRPKRIGRPVSYSERNKIVKKGVQFKRNGFKLRGRKKTFSKRCTRATVTKVKTSANESGDLEDQNFKIVNAVSVLSSENGTSDTNTMEEDISIVTIGETNNSSSYLSDEEKACFSALSNRPLTLEQLEGYLHIVKNSRVPEKVALSYFDENNIYNASLSDLAHQLNVYSSVCNFPSMKSRISRIVSQISELL